MTVIKSFKAIRPTPGLAHKVAALPYDVYNSREAKAVAQDNPYSFLHVDKSEIDLPEGTNPYNDIVYKKAAENLNNLIKKDILTKDATPCLYLYRLTMDGRSQVGLVCCSWIDDYINGVIKKHELTRADKELDRINHVDYCNSNTGPIFLTYPSKDEINNITSKWIDDHSSIYDFTSNDSIRHECWKIDDANTIENFIDLFESIENTYIADGHHRTASAVKVGLMRRKNAGNFDGTEEFNYFLSVLFPHDQLHIMDYNRVVKDLNGLSLEDFIDKLKSSFDIINTGTNPYKPNSKGTIGMYIDNSWYKITLKDNLINSNDPVKNLDVSILQENILTPILGIEDIRTDNRIDFVGGIRGLKELEKRCNNDMRLAFAMYPTSIEELMEISDANKLMPPKSTWFEPKLRSGLFIHELRD